MFTTTNEGNVRVLQVSGRIDPTNWRELADTLKQLTESQGDLLIDLEHLEYMASAGFRELFLAGRRLARDGGKLAVCSLQGEVRRIFDLAGFATAYPVFEHRQEALAHLQAH